MRRYMRRYPWVRWTPEEDSAVLAARHGELKPLAWKLGRSYEAAMMRRYNLRRKEGR